MVAPFSWRCMVHDLKKGNHLTSEKMHNLHDGSQGDEQEEMNVLWAEGEKDFSEQAKF